MMKSKEKLSSSNDEEQQKCLPSLRININRNNTDVSSLQNLSACDIITCEFCDEVFLSRYNFLIHNASHIIIPLINLKLHQCTECLQHFTTEGKLARHITKKHPGITNGKSKWKLGEESQTSEDESLASLEEWDNSHAKSRISQNNKSEFRISKIGFNVSDSSDQHLTSKRKLRHITVKPEGITNSNSRWKLKQESDNSEDESLTALKERRTSQNSKSEFRITKTEFDAIDTDSFFNLELYGRSNTAASDSSDVTQVKVGPENIKNRIQFEEELDTDLMTDLTTECKVSVEMFDQPWLMSVLKESNSKCIDENVNDDVSEMNQRAIVHESVHYDELLKEQLYVCKYCGVRSTNRYYSIKHETTHMSLRNTKTYCCPFCDYHVSNTRKGLAEHTNSKHPGLHVKQEHALQCRSCGLDYRNHYRHMRNYHYIYVCRICCQRFERAEQRDDHYAVCKNTTRIRELERKKASVGAKAVKLCNLCYSFLMGKTNLSYEFVGDYCQDGERLPCEKCHRKCIELKMVMRVLVNNRPTEYKKYRKALTNEARLKNIRQRLKNMRNYNA